MSRRVRTLIRRALPGALAAWLALIAWLLASTPAVAGAPVRVLVASPATQTVASLHVSSADYATLYRAVGGDTPTPQDDAPTKSAWPQTGAVNLVWLVHDVSVWRADAIVVEPDGELWVYTQLGGTGAEGIWHRSPYQDELLDLLDRLGVEMPGLEAGMADTSAAEAGMADISTAEGDKAAQRDAADAETRPWRWLVTAAAGGLLLGVGGDRWLRRHREPWLLDTGRTDTGLDTGLDTGQVHTGQRDTGVRPRQELIDL